MDLCDRVDRVDLVDLVDLVKSGSGHHDRAERAEVYGITVQRGGADAGLVIGVKLGGAEGAKATERLPEAAAALVDGPTPSPTAS